MTVDLTQDLPPSLEERFKIVLTLAADSDVLSEAMKNELKAMLDPTNLAMVVGVFVVWAGSHAFGVGLIFDGLMIGVSLFMVGWSTWEAAEKIADFIDRTIRARTMDDLKVASTMLATAIAILSVKMFQRLITKGASGATMGGKTRKADPGKDYVAVKDQPRPVRKGGASGSAPPVKKAKPGSEDGGAGTGAKKKAPSGGTPAKKEQKKPRQPRTYEKMKTNVDGTKTYTFKKKDGGTADVTYKDGYPDFSEHKYKGTAGKSEVTIDMTGKNNTDFQRANEAAGFGKGANSHPDGHTWHHHQDGKTMQLVKTDVHSVAPHTGGASHARGEGGHD